MKDDCIWKPRAQWTVTPEKEEEEEEDREEEKKVIIIIIIIRYSFCSCINFTRCYVICRYSSCGDRRS